MSQTKSQSKGFTLIELLVVVGIIGALIGILVPVLAIARKRSNMMLEGANLSSATKSLALYGDGNKTFYPGLSSTGKFSTASFQGGKYWASANGSAPTTGYATNETNSYAWAVLLEEGSVAPKQLIAPGGETGGNSAGAALVIAEIAPEATSLKAPTTATDGQVQSHLHTSFAMLAYSDATLRSEWKATTSNEAPVLSTRLIFGEGNSPAPGVANFNSVWTDAQSGKWEGSVARNDASVGREKFNNDVELQDSIKNLKFGSTIYSVVAISNAARCGLWGKSAGTATSGTAFNQANFGSTPAVAPAPQTVGFLGAAND
jgi:prepilin-type N-terminal cleavage/methylation domain-containing protein